MRGLDPGDSGTRGCLGREGQHCCHHSWSADTANDRGRCEPRWALAGFQGVAGRSRGPRAGDGDSVGVHSQSIRTKGWQSGSVDKRATATARDTLACTQDPDSGSWRDAGEGDRGQGGGSSAIILIDRPS